MCEQSIVLEVMGLDHLTVNDTYVNMEGWCPSQPNKNKVMIIKDELKFLTFSRDELIDFDDLSDSTLQGSLLILAQSRGLE